MSSGYVHPGAWEDDGKDHLFSARAKLAKTDRLVVLVDNTCLRWGITHRTNVLPLGSREWGGEAFEAFVTQRRPLSANPDAELNLRHIVGIAQLARESLLDAKSYWLLRGERTYKAILRQRTVMDFDAWQDVELQDVDDPLELGGIKIARDILGLSAGYSLNVDGEPTRNSRHALEQMVKMNRDARFLEIWAALGSHQKMSFDAHHIWFAEKHGCAIFLTYDTKLLNVWNSVLRSRKNPQCAVRVLSPSTLGGELSIDPPRLRQASWW